MHLFRDLGAHLLFRDSQVIARLQVQLELRRGSKVPGQSQGRVGRNGTPFPHDLVDARRRHLELQRQRMGAHPQRPEKLLPQNFARMNGTHLVGRIHRSVSSMIIDDLHVKSIARTRMGQGPSYDAQFPVRVIPQS
jgi:hypothetical protein